MKTINNFINEKLKISSRSKFYSCQPKDKFELRKILEKRLKEDKNADLNDIDVSKITNMSCKGFINNQGLFEDLDPHNIDISLWDVSNVTDMRALFYECENLNCDLSNWDVSNVKNMGYMFNCCENFNTNLSNWDVSNVKDMDYMFQGCENFNCDLSNWNVSKVKYMWCMFDNCDSLKRKPKWYKKYKK